MYVRVCVCARSQLRTARSTCCLVTSSHQRHHDNAAADYIDPITYEEIGRHGYQFTREIDPDSVTIESTIARGNVRNSVRRG